MEDKHTVDGCGPDIRPGFYYVSIEYNGERRLVRGPWTSHEGAIRALPATKARCERADLRACWYAYGTARSETDLGPGLLGAPEEYDGPAMANVRPCDGERPMKVRGYDVRVAKISGRFAVYLGEVCLTDDEEGPFPVEPSIRDIEELMDFSWVAEKIRSAR